MYFQSLLPHDTHDDHQGGHSKQGIYKGLVAFAGVYFFFLTERIMGIVTEWRRRINREKNKKVSACDICNLFSIALIPKSLRIGPEF